MLFFHLATFWRIFQQFLDDDFQIWVKIYKETKCCWKYFLSLFLLKIQRNCIFMVSYNNCCENLRCLLKSLIKVVYICLAYTISKFCAHKKEWWCMIRVNRYSYTKIIDSSFETRVSFRYLLFINMCLFI